MKKIYTVFISVLFFTFIACSYALETNQASKSTVITQLESPASVKTFLIPLNTAEAKILANAVKGIGKKRAEAIVAYRKEHGPFKSLESLAEVPGLGKKFIVSHLEDLKNTFTVG